MAPKTCVNRLKKEMRAFLSNPPPHIPELFVNEANMLEWHFLIEGPPDSPYVGGWYVGKLRFPPEYPFKPPAIMMVTPSGRFETDRRLCLSMSDFHPETWNPMWSLSTIMTGLLSFMLEDTATTGSLKTTDEEKQQFAAASLEWNLGRGLIVNMFPSLKARAEERAKGGSEPAQVADGTCGTSSPASEGPVASTSASAAAGEQTLVPGPPKEPASPLREATPPRDPPAPVREPAAGLGFTAGGGARGGGPLVDKAPLHPDDVATVRGAAQELRHGEPQAASSRLDRAISRHKGKPPAWILICKGRALAQLGELETAATLAAVAVALPPPQLAGLSMEDSITFALLSNPQSWLSRWQAASALKAKGNDAFRSGKMEEAKQAYTEALRQEASCAPLLSNLAAVDAQLGDHPAAIKHADAALQLHRDYHKARRRLADSLMAVGDYARAASMYATLVSLGDESVRPPLEACKKKASAA